MMSIDMETPSFESVVSGLWVVIAVLGFILNLIQIIWIIRQKRRLIDPFTISLAVVDLQTCCFNIPLEVVELTGGYDWFGSSDADVACGFYWFFRYERVICGSIIVCLIAVCRYIAIAHPIKNSPVSCSPMRFNLILAAITWIITLSLVIPLVFTTASVPTVNVISATTENGAAVRVRCTQKQSGLGVVIYGSVLFFVAPVLIMSISHILLIRIFVKRKNNKLLAYKGSSKHFRTSVVNSSLILAYIPIVAPQGIYEIIQLARETTPQTNIETALRLAATLIVISNPLVYSFLTPGFIKCADRYSQWLRETLKRHRDLRILWSSADWSSKEQPSSTLRRFLSDENHKHHHDNKHSSSISRPNNHPIRPSSETQNRSPQPNFTRVDIETLRSGSSVRQSNEPVWEGESLLTAGTSPESTRVGNTDVTY